MTVATWNVNSIRARLERVLAWLEKAAPDIVCLQELKTTETDFPYEPLEAAGYRAAVFGQKTYNGVAILSREAPDDVILGLDDNVDDPQARLITARFGETHVLSAYAPNGKIVGSPQWEYKLAWFRRLRAFLERRFSPDDAVLLCGDLNVARRRLPRPMAGQRALPPRRPPRPRRGDRLGPRRHHPPPSRRPRPLHVVGLPQPRLPEGQRPPHRPHPRHPTDGRPMHRRLRRPGRAERTETVRPRPRPRRLRRMIRMDQKRGRRVSRSVSFLP